MHRWFRVVRLDVSYSAAGCWQCTGSKGAVLIVRSGPDVGSALLASPWHQHEHVSEHVTDGAHVTKCSRSACTSEIVRVEGQHATQVQSEAHVFLLSQWRQDSAPRQDCAGLSACAVPE